MLYSISTDLKINKFYAHNKNVLLIYNYVLYILCQDEERLQMVEQKRKMEEDRRALEKAQRKAIKAQQDVVLNRKGGNRAKLSFSIAPKSS